MPKKYFIFFLISVTIIFGLTGCTKKEEKDIENKLDIEIEYVEDLIFKIVNKSAKKEYIENDEINWNYIKDDVSRINNTWATLILDLAEVNVSNDDIINFSNDLNNTLISVSNKDENTLIQKLSSMEDNLIKFEKSYSDQRNKIEKKNIKAGMLRVYSLIKNQEFLKAENEIQGELENYKNLMNDKSYADENRYDLNKLYILLEEYSNSIQTGNLDLISIKYINAVENF